MRKPAALLLVLLLLILPAGAGSLAFAEDAAAPEETRTAEASGSDASAYFHAVITTNKETYTSGESALVSIRYTIDPGAIAPGDYVIVTIPPEIAQSASFSVSRQHFESTEDLGNGQYRLTFGGDAATGLSGSMSVRVSLSTEETTTGTISAGEGEKEITVVASGSGGSGTGTFENEAIMKDGLGNEGMSYGGYDYSQGEPTQIGIFDSSVDQDFVYRLYINRKNVRMTDVIVTDTLPDGMEFKGGGSVVCYRMDPSTMSRTEEVLSQAKITLSGRNLTIVLGDIDYPVQIEYAVHIPAQTSVQLRNHAEVAYTQDGNRYKEQRDYIAQGNDFSASNGVKSVDKTILSDLPSDQWVTYTIRFWNENRFAAGEISLTDDLDDYVRFLYADDNEYFQLTVDPEDPTILHITNVKPIPASTEVYETFVCDFTGVPVGYTVCNTTGGNTTRTTKISESLPLTAHKTVEGEAPAEGEVFRFRLMDGNHKVLQTQANDENGDITFDKIRYGKEALGKTFTYYIREVVPSGKSRFEYDPAEYVVTAVVGEEAGEDGVVPVEATITRDGEPVDAMTFDNQRKPEEPAEPEEPEQTAESPERGEPADTPDTGDTAVLLRWAALMTGALLSLAALRRMVGR